MKFPFFIIFACMLVVCVICRPQQLASAYVETNECDALSCTEDDVKPRNLVCAVSDHGSVASFRSECGVKLLNCYQKLHNGPQYHVVARKVCVHRDVLFLRGRCDQLICEIDGQPEKPACATNGDNFSLFKSSCHIEILNCYQRMYGKPHFKQIPFKNCAMMKHFYVVHANDTTHANY